MRLRFLGAARKVTGSACHLLSGDFEVLVDCGIEQGIKPRPAKKTELDLDPQALDYLFVTHAHIDHIGLIPKLVKDGFRGRIITTPATKDLMRIMLLDSASLTGGDVSGAGPEHRGTSYSEADIEKMAPLIDTVQYGRTVELEKGLRVRFRNAGHILGSASIELWATEAPTEKKLVFSGDLGKKGTPIIRDPDPPLAADWVIMESTYGDRLHRSLSESIDELLDVIKGTFVRGGNVLMPAFAVGRTEDILYTLNNLVLEGRLSPVDVYLDSPLAQEALRIYLSHPELFDDDAKQDLKGDRRKGIRIHAVESMADSRAIDAIPSGAIIVAGSGMCQGGRIVYHLKQHLWRPESSVVFTGFQAENTLGRALVEGLREADILGEQLPVRSRIHTIGGFSAHADQSQLLEWLGSFVDRPRVFLVHGEEETMRRFADLIRERLGLVVNMPTQGQEYTL